MESVTVYQATALERALAELAQVRRDAEAAKARQDAAQAELEATPFFEAVQLEREYAKQLQGVERATYDLVCNLAVAAYRETGNKKPVPSVTIRVSAKPRYSVAEMTEWAREHAPTLLALDTKLADKIGPSMPGAPITMEETVSAAVGKDLSGYLDVVESHVS